MKVVVIPSYDRHSGGSSRGLRLLEEEELVPGIGILHETIERHPRQERIEVQVGPVLVGLSFIVCDEVSGTQQSSDPLMLAFRCYVLVLVEIVAPLFPEDREELFESAFAFHHLEEPL